MDRVAILLAHTQTLRRSLWASLPLGHRIAQVIMRLAASGAEAFGQGIYLQFLRSGVLGMPDVGTVPAAEFDASGKNAEAKLRSIGYGNAFGKKMYAALLAVLRRPDLVDETMSSFLLRVIQGALKGMRPGTGIYEAEKYVKTGLINEAKNTLKRTKRNLQREQSMSGESDEGEEVVLDIRDPKFLESLEEDFPLQEILKNPGVRGKLQAIHPDAQLYVELALQDYDDTAIVGEPSRGRESMLPHVRETPMDPFNWKKTYRPKIYKVLSDFAKHMSQPAARHN